MADDEWDSLSGNNKKPRPARVSPGGISDEDRDWFTPEQVGKSIGVAAQTIRRWIKDGLLIAKRTPTGLFKIHKDEMNAMLAASALSNKQVS